VEQAEDKWFTVGDFHLKIPPHLTQVHIRRLLKEGKLKGYHGRKLGREWIIEKDAPVQDDTGAYADIKTSITEEELKVHLEELYRLVNRLWYLWDRSVKGLPEDCYEGMIINERDLIQIDPMIADSLVSHLKAEFAEFKNVEGWPDLVSFKLVENGAAALNRLDLLKKRLATRKEFKGKCFLCGSD